MDGGDPILISSRWYIWRIGDPDFTKVGRLTGENREAEVGLVFSEEDIIHRLRTGEYDLRGYPEFD